jgi:hypothetical protein
MCTARNAVGTDSYVSLTFFVGGLAVGGDPQVFLTGHLGHVQDYSSSPAGLSRLCITAHVLMY